MSDPVLFSYSLDGLGGGAALHDGAVSRLLKDDQLTWAHLNADHPDTAAWLRREDQDCFTKIFFHGFNYSFKCRYIGVRRKA